MPIEHKQISAEKVVEEVWHVRDQYGYKGIMFFDDIFAINKERLCKIRDGLKGSGMTLRGLGRANLLTQEVCGILREMNFVEIGVGIESCANSVLSMNMKGTTKEVNTKAITNLRKAGLRVKVFIIIGLPGETEETVEETRQWLAEMRPDDVDINLFQPLPGTEIFNHPGRWGISFDYEHSPNWYKGIPGGYTTTVSSRELSSQRRVALRNALEQEFKEREKIR
jgi:radical SAM superfamily enzyme YgiQ (UPF0313 family)